MKTPFPVSFRAIAVLLAVSFVSTATATLQLVAPLNPAMAAAASGNGDSWAPLASPDGRYVLFASTADNLVGPSNGIPKLNPPSVNVFLRDRVNRTTTLVSVNLSGVGGNGNSLPTGLSSNGQFALFESAASDLVTNDTNQVNDVFLRDTINNITKLVSAATNGACGNGVSRGSTLTPDGRFVAFVSEASNLIPDDTNGIADVFVRDLLAGTTAWVSVGAISNGVGSSSEAPEITPDGRYVVFSSTATNLVAGVTNSSEIYVRDLQAGTTTWASTNARTSTNGLCYNQAISSDGQFVAFEISSNAVSTYNPTNKWVFRYNLQTGHTDIVFTNTLYSVGVADFGNLNMSPDGRFIVYVRDITNNFPGGSAVFLWDAQSGTNILVSVNRSNSASLGANAYWPDLDPTGRYVVFYSTDTNLTAEASPGIFLRDLQAGTTTLVSVDTNGVPLVVNPTAVPAFGGSGTIAFESSWANLDGRNFECDVFARDLTNAASELISVHDPNLASVAPNGPCELWPGSASANGRFVAFSSPANNLLPNDTNRCPDVFVRDLVTGSTVLVSVATNGLTGSGISDEPAISGDGRYVAFTSAATNLVAGDANQVPDVFLRDLQVGATTLISVTTNGAFGNKLSYSPTVSSDGRYVLFCSQAQNLVPGTFTGDNLFLRDLQLGQTYGLTTGGYVSYSMTPDGQNVAFITVAGGNTILYVWNSPAAAMIYTNTSSGLTNVSISPDAHWVVYAAGGALFAQDLIASTNTQIAAGSLSPRAGLKFSSDGRFLAYAGTNDVYLYDFQVGTNLLVSHAFNSTSPANGVSDSPVISADGRFVVFRSFASNCLAVADSNGAPDICLFDRLSNSNVLASANLGGVPGNNRSLLPVFTSDGQTLLFQSWASDLVTQDFSLGSGVFALNTFLLNASTNPPAAFDARIALSANYNSPAASPAPLITWLFTPGQTYSVQYKTNLTDPVWHDLPGAVTFIGNQGWFNPAAAPTDPQQFYRVVSGN